MIIIVQLLTSNVSNQTWIRKAPTSSWLYNFQFVGYRSTGTSQNTEDNFLCRLWIEKTNRLHYKFQETSQENIIEPNVQQVPRNRSREYYRTKRSKFSLTRFTRNSLSFTWQITCISFFFWFKNHMHLIIIYIYIYILDFRGITPLPF